MIRSNYGLPGFQRLQLAVGCVTKLNYSGTKLVPKKQSLTSIKTSTENFVTILSQND